MTPYRALLWNASLALALAACRGEEAPPAAPTETVFVPPAPAGSVAVPAPPPDPEPPFELRSEPAGTDDLSNVPTGPPGMAPFDRSAAVMSLAQVRPERCKLSGHGPTGTGHVTITFGPDGRVTTAVIDGGPFAGTSVGTCIEQRYRAVTVPPFAGGPVRVGKSFAIH